MRYRRVLLSERALRTILCLGVHSYEVIQDGFPRDARIVNARHSFENPAAVELLIESSEFSPVAEGAVIPLFTPVIKGEALIL